MPLILLISGNCSLFVAFWLSTSSAVVECIRFSNRCSVGGGDWFEIKDLSELVAFPK